MCGVQCSLLLHGDMLGGNVPVTSARYPFKTGAREKSVNNQKTFFVESTKCKILVEIYLVSLKLVIY